MTILELINIRQMQVTDFEKIPEDYLERFDLGVQDYDYLRSQDFVYGELKNKETGKVYVLIHGFPGDNSDGCIYDPQNGEIVGEIGEGCDEDEDEYTQWYHSLGDDVCQVLCVGREDSEED
jgi:hypothetical protein